MKIIAYLIILVFLPFHYANAQTAGYNFDFEDWHTDSLAAQRLDRWEHIGRNDDVVYQLHGTKKSAQSRSGNYAVTVHRWYVIDKDALRLKHSISQKPNFLNGFYTYTDAILAVHADSSAVNDIATVTAYFTKWNPLLNRPDTIGYGYQELSATTGYTPFSCAITYSNTSQPDSFYIYIRPTKFSSRLGCKINPDCSFLTVDNLSFSSTTSIDDADATNSKISIFPNPAMQELSISVHPGVIVQKIYLADIAGRVVMALDGNIPKILLSHLSRGNYFLKLQTNEGFIVKKVVVK